METREPALSRGLGLAVWLCCLIVRHASCPRWAMLFLLAPIVALLLDLGALAPPSARPQDLQILLLHQQLRILQRTYLQHPHKSHWARLALAVLDSKLNYFGRGAKTKLDETLFLFKPDTLLRWHRELVRHKDLPHTTQLPSARL